MSNPYKPTVIIERPYDALSAMLDAKCSPKGESRYDEFEIKGIGKMVRRLRIDHAGLVAVNLRQFTSGTNDERKILASVGVNPNFLRVPVHYEDGHVNHWVDFTFALLSNFEWDNTVGIGDRSDEHGLMHVDTKATLVNLVAGEFDPPRDTDSH